MKPFHGPNLFQFNSRSKYIKNVFEDSYIRNKQGQLYSNYKSWANSPCLPGEMMKKTTILL